MKIPGLFLAALLMSSAASAQNITPGLWKAQTKIKLGSMAMPSIDVDDCISANEAKDVKKYIQENLMPDTQCTIKKWDYKKPDLKASLTCTNAQYDAKGELSGKVTDKAFNIAGTLHGTHVVMGDLDVGIDYKGTYTKACK